MAKGPIYLGIAWIFFAAWLLYTSKSWIAFGVNAVIGLALIIFHSSEDKIEERKDLNKKQNKQ